MAELGRAEKERTTSVADSTEANSGLPAQTDPDRSRDAARGRTKLFMGFLSLGGEMQPAGR